MTHAIHTAVARSSATRANVARTDFVTAVPPEVETSGDYALAAWRGAAESWLEEDQI